MQRQNEQLTLHIANLEQQLLVTREAESQLDEQKQENLLLKETIDRMKFDMEELRHKADGNIPSSLGHGEQSKHYQQEPRCGDHANE